MEQIRKPTREKFILYTISMTMMHPPAAIKCLGEEKTICNLRQVNIKGNQLAIWNATFNPFQYVGSIKLLAAQPTCGHIVNYTTGNTTFFKKKFSIISKKLLRKL